MRRETFALVAGFLFSICALGNADFKYTVSAQVTGGPLAGKFPQATETTTYVRDAYLRIDLPDGSHVIGDLKESREIWVNPNTRTYSVLNYDKLFGPPPPGGQRAPQPTQNPGPKVPTMSAVSTGKTKVLMGQASQEVAGRLTYDPDEYVEIESWTAPSVPGFKEVEEFHSRLAAAFPRSDPAALKAELDLWPALEAAAAGDPAWGPAAMRVVSEISGPGSGAKGFPMLQTLRLIRMMTREQQARLRPGEQQPQPAEKSTASPPGAAAASTNNAPSGKEAVPAAEFTFRVTSYSAQPLEESLFRVLAGYVLSEMGKKDRWPVAILP